jgi:hypothetical protein
MKKIRNNTFRVVVILLMLSTAPLGVIIFSGKMEESGKENVFAISFMNSTQIPETSQSIKLLQFGAEDLEYLYPTECNQLVKNPCLVV